MAPISLRPDSRVLIADDDRLWSKLSEGEYEMGFRISKRPVEAGVFSASAL